VAQKVARSIEPVVHARLTARTWQDRLQESTSLRTKLYEVIMPFSPVWTTITTHIPNP
jgi:hypothetical protein